MSYEDDSFFEDEVRRIARARWPQAQYDGAKILDGRERDGVFETDDVIHYVEATTSRRSDKAKDDAKKLFALMSQQQRGGSMKGAIGWFVTRDEPTADQREEVRQYGKQQVKAVSFAQFQQAIVDVGSYLSHRENHFFGSVLDPETGSINPSINYIPIDLVQPTSNDLFSIEQLADGLAAGQSYSILGDYGAGKSMTLRQLYFSLRDRYRSGNTPIFPLYINLREHSGQDDPAEVLERHGRRIGFEKPHSLVSAWRAGFAILILDGFDEITTLGISGVRTKLKETRRRSLVAVRQLIEQTPKSVGVIVAGREHFFNNATERNSALGLELNAITLSVGEFNQKQVAKYLDRAGAKFNFIPGWMPTRPLLVGYIAARGLLSALNDISETMDPVDGWDLLLDRIFERESKISPNLDGPTLRSILERLATIARSTSDGLGPVTQQQIRTAFVQVCETEPDEQANLLLQRLPGLGVYRAEEDSRTFVDAELAEVCRAHDIVEFIANPYGSVQDEGWRSAVSVASLFVGPTAVTRIARALKERMGASSSLFDNAYTLIQQKGDIGVIASDVAAVCIDMLCAPAINSVAEGAFYEGYTFSFTEEMPDLSSMTFRDCFFDAIEISHGALMERMPRFQGCVFMTVRGRTGVDELSKDKFDAYCVFEHFSDSVQTQSNILGSSLAKGEKIVLTVLRKLFVQSLGGRAESALFRGLDLNDRQFVPGALKLLQQHGFVEIYNRGDGNIWLPNRKNIARARKILAAPNLCNDDLLIAAKELDL